MTMTATTLSEWKTGPAPQWCPGCGDFGVLAALQRALADSGLAPEEVVLVAGIGCTGRIPNYMNTYGMHVTHGRVLPAAMGVKLANPKLTVIGTGGDGDGFAIGMSHFVHACRRNVDMTYIVADNHIYGLTKGQTSPTSGLGFVSKSTPGGNVEPPAEPLMLALTAGATYVAQGFSGNQKALVRLIEGGIRHPGFAFINVTSPCVTYNPVYTAQFFRTNLYDLDNDPAWEPKDRLRAMQVLEEHRQMVHGLLYQAERPTYHALLPGFDGAVSAAGERISPAAWSQLLNRFR